MKVDVGLRQDKPKRKFRLGMALVIVVISLCVGLAVASVHVGNRLGVGGLRWPWEFFELIQRQGGVWKQEGYKILGLVACMAGAFQGIIAAISSRRGKAHESLHGSSRWAKQSELKDMGILEEQGVYVGGFVGKGDKLLHLRHDGPEHILVFAPTRSGKGVSLILPTLVTTPEKSCVVLDIKGENYALTAGWRGKHGGNKIVRLDFASPESHRYNPLLEIEVGTEREIAQAQNLAQIVMAKIDGKGDDHWTTKGRTLLSALVLHALHNAKDTGEVPTLAQVGRLLSDPTSNMEEILEDMVNNSPSPTAKRVAREMLDTPEKERGSIVSTFQSKFEVFEDPIVERNTATSDFQLSEVMNGNKPMSLYLIVQPRDQDRLRPLVRLFISQLLRSVTADMEFKDGRSVEGFKHRCILLLDEFASLGSMPVVEENLAYMAGYGMKAYLIVQDIAQITKYYGREQSILGNCHVKIAFAPNNLDTAEFLSKLTGTTTVTKTSVSISGKRSAGMLNQMTESMQEHSRPLLTPDECMRLPGIRKEGGKIKAGDLLTFVAGNPPVQGRQTLYFQDKMMQARCQVEPPKPIDREEEEATAIVVDIEAASAGTGDESFNAPSAADIAELEAEMKALEAGME